jgi:endoglucanase
MLDIMTARGLSFSYHAYHEDAFGIFRGGGALPDPAQANVPLMDLLTRKLGAAPAAKTGH